MEIEVRKCTHIKVNGTQCGSPALKTGTRCYFHEQAARRTRTSIMHRPAVLPLLEDANAIQVALMDVIHDLRQDYIDIKVAGKLLYALQIATANLKRMDLNREDSVTDLPSDATLPEPIGVPRAGYVKLPYEGIPDPTLPNFAPTASVTPSEVQRPLSSPEGSACTSLVSGHDFSRADEPERNARALAPASSPAPSTVAPQSRRQSPSTDTNIPTEGSPASKSHKRPSGSSTSAPPTPHLAVSTVQRKLAAAKKGNVQAARELFEFAGIMPRQ